MANNERKRPGGWTNANIIQRRGSEMTSRKRLTAFPAMNRCTTYFLQGFFAASIVIVLTSQATADPALGKAKVQTVCAVCHGVDGIGKNPDVPNLAGESSQYIQKQLKAFRSGGR